MKRRTLLRGVGAAGIGAAAGCSSFVGSSPDAAFYVSPDGDDGWSGERPEPAGDDGPFRTIERAQRAVRERDWSGREEPVRVLLRGGTYRREEPLQFTSADSGSEDAPVEYAAYPGERPVLDAGRTVDGWEATTVNGVDAWTTTVPAVRDGDWYFRSLFVDGERRPRSRLPKAVNEVFEDGATPTSQEERFFHFTDTSGERTFAPEAGSVDPAWRNLDDVEVVSIERWYDERAPVESVETGDGGVASVTLAFRPYPGKPWDERFYYVENVFETLSEPGEWYLDRGSGECWYVPKAGEEPGEVDVVAPRVRRPLRIRGDHGDPVEHLRFAGLGVEHSAWEYPDTGNGQSAANTGAAVTFRRARDCAFVDGTVRGVGEYAIAIEEGCRRIAVRRCELADLGAGGLQIGGARAGSDRTGENRIVDNHVHDGGRVFHRGAGVLAMATAGNVVAYNHVHDLYYTGVSVGWSWGFADSVADDNRVAYNHIHHIGRGLLSDMGGVYTLGVQPGTVVRGNRIHHVDQHRYGGWGLYPDEGSTGITWERNVVYETGTEPFNLHYGRENRIENNVLVAGEDAAAISGGPTVDDGDGSTTDRTALRIARNVLVVDGGTVVEGHPDLVESDHNCFWDDDGEVTVGTVAEVGEHNVITTHEYGLEEWREATGDDEHSIVADPRFVDPEQDDYALAEGSPALDPPVDFEPIDRSAVGPRADGEDS